MDLFSDLKKAKRGAIAKAITIFENDEKESRKLIKKIFKKSKKNLHESLSAYGVGFHRHNSEIEQEINKVSKVINNKFFIIIIFSVAIYKTFIF